MSLKKNSFLFLIFLSIYSEFNFQFAFSQKDDSSSECSDPDDKEAIELYKKSRDKKKYEYAKRTEFLEKAYEISNDYAPVAYELGMHWQRRADEAGGSCEKCEPYFLSVIKNCPKYHSNSYFFLGKLYFEQEKYDSAIRYMKKFMDFKEDDLKKYDKLRYDRFLVDARRYINWGKFYKETLGNPVPYNPKLVEGISTLKDEYLPFISPDNEIAFFTRRIKVQPIGVAWDMSQEKEFFCYSKRGVDGKFPEGEPMPTPPFNIHFNEGGASITIDNKHLYYTVVEQDGNYDIYYTDFVNGDWQESKSMGNIINSADRWDSQPSISADGKTLYFASNRPGGYGGIDIWKTEKDTAGVWKAPVNLGPNINTEGDEKAPFLHWDNKTLYFSAGDNEDGYSGYMSLGGFDIFYSKMDSATEINSGQAGKWMKPKNIGYPINTAGDDVGFFVSSDGRNGFFASNDNRKTQGKSVGGYDLYYFELPQNVRPDEVAIIKGKVTNDSGKVVKAVDVELKDAVTKKVTKALVDSTTGEYAVAANVEKKHDQLLIVKKDGYAFSSQLMSFKDEVKVKDSTSTLTSTSTLPDNPDQQHPIERSPIIKINLQTDSIKEGKAFTLNHIYFGPNRADLKGESKFVLDEFTAYLKSNPNLKIDIYGHTDNIGSPNDNQNLSADRAFTVLEYLRSCGVNKEQISGYKGFGETKPVAPNDTEEGRAKNRRTEFFIASK